MHKKLIIVSFLFSLLLSPQLASAQERTLSVSQMFKSAGEFDPIERNARNEIMFYELIFDALLQLDEEGNIGPYLATEWSETDEGITFTLRDDVVFSDGTPFTADVVRANIERAQAQGTAMIQDDLFSIEAVEVLGDHEVRFILSERDPFLLQRLSGYAGMMVSPMSFDDDESLSLIGSGPFVLNEDESISRSIYVFDANPLYRDAASMEFDRMEWSIVEVIGGVNGLLAGDFDISVTVAGVVRLLAGQAELFSQPASLYMGVIVDRDGILQPELGNRDVRCALNHAVDRDAFVEVAGPGVFEPTHRFLPESWYGYAPDAPTYDYDPERARELLAAAGAEDLVLEMPTNAGYLSQYEPFVGFLNDAGIAVETEILATGQIVPVTFGGEVAINYYNPSPEHISLFVRDFFLEDGPFNPFNATDDEITALYNEAVGLPFDEAEPLWQEIVRVIQRECYMVPLAAGSLVVATADYVEGETQRLLTPGYLDLRAITVNR